MCAGLLRSVIGQLVRVTVRVAWLLGYGQQMVGLLWWLAFGLLGVDLPAVVLVLTCGFEPVDDVFAE